VVGDCLGDKNRKLILERWLNGIMVHTNRSGVLIYLRT
jgi:hypothetical protein